MPVIPEDDFVGDPTPLCPATPALSGSVRAHLSIPGLDVPRPSLNAGDHGGYTRTIQSVERNDTGMRRTVIGVAALTGVATALSGVANADAAPGKSSPQARVTVVGGGFTSAFGLAKLGKRNLLVADADAGKVVLLGPHGGKRVLVSRADGVSGVATKSGKVFSVTGGGDETRPTPAGHFGPSRVLRTNLRTGKTKVIANLLTYELKHNPDGQVQNYTPPAGQEKDALSNPFAMGSYPRGLLVADGGANDVLRVNPRTGKVSTFFVPPTVQQAGCQQANPGTTGCDSVPTGVTYAKGSVWVSTLGADTPGAGRIYKLNPRNGHVRQVWKGLDSPTGVAIGGRGAIFYSQVLANFPATGPGPGFDPSTVGQVSRIFRGKTTHAKVTLPVGLVLRRGALFSTAWATANEFGIPHEAQVVRVHGYDFR
jgi:hypothetical protein